MAEHIVKQEKFELKTKIHTEILWDDSLPQDKNVAEQRFAFEKKVQEFANFMNEKLGESILNALDKIL